MGGRYVCVGVDWVREVGRGKWCGGGGGRRWGIMRGGCLVDTWRVGGYVWGRGYVGGVTFGVRGGVTWGRGVRWEGVVG